MVIAEGVEEKDDFDLIKINRPHVGNLCMHSKNFVSAIIEGCVMPIAEIEGLLEKKELGMRTKFLMALLKFREDEVRGRKVGYGIVIRFGDVLENEPAEGAVICLPYVVHLGVDDGIRLRQGAF
jgi:hypothetical protein